MKHKPFAVIAPVAVAGILMLAILAAIYSTNQVFAQKSVLTMQVRLGTLPPTNGAAKTVGEVSEKVPVTVTGRLSTENNNVPIPGVFIIVNCDGERCGGSDTDNRGQWYSHPRLNATPESTHTIEASTQNMTHFDKSEASMTIKLCKVSSSAWSICQSSH